ncbi:MAG: carbonic anhydrase, partial [Casimicrobiaceae bacterium]
MCARVDRRKLSLHGWNYVIEAGEVHPFEVNAGGFMSASLALHSGTGPYADANPGAFFNEIDS